VSERKESTTFMVFADGKALNVKMLDGIIIDDILVQGMKAEGYRVITGLDEFPNITRKTIDYLLRIGVISE
jgi:hypothetical protein